MGSDGGIDDGVVVDDVVVAAGIVDVDAVVDVVVVVAAGSIGVGCDKDQDSVGDVVGGGGVDVAAVDVE